MENRIDEEPPPSTVQDRKPVQLVGSDRLPDRTMRSSNSWRRELAFVLLAPGSKPYLGLYNSTRLY